MNGLRTSLEEKAEGRGGSWKDRVSCLWSEHWPSESSVDKAGLLEVEREPEEQGGQENRTPALVGDKFSDCLKLDFESPRALCTKEKNTE